MSCLNRSGIYPSPYNYIGKQRVHLDEYVIHDSTLREGEQTPGIHYTLEDKINIAKKLDEIGIRRIEAGFPAASEKQFKVIKRLSCLNLDADIIGFARARVEDIDAAVNAGVDGIIVSYSISGFHREIKFNGLTKEQYLEKLIDAISYAENKGVLTIFSAEDASRERDLDFLKSAYSVAVQSGAKRARIIDTLGCLSPQGATYLVSEIRKTVEIPLEVHFHNDMGLALANSICALEAGANSISTCVNGLGERAGITATEEAMAALHIFYGVNQFKLNMATELSNLLDDITGITRSPGKPITGENVLVHSSGIHHQGVLRNPKSYEFYPPGLFGQSRRIEINELGGRHSVLYVAKNILGLEISESLANVVISKIKNSFVDGKRSNPYSPEEIKKLILDELRP